MKPSYWRPWDTPSRTDVEQAIATLEIEDAREKEAIRKFWDHERSVRKVQLGKYTLLWAFVVGVLFAAAALYVAYWLVNAVKP